ncbi:YkvA family protein [Virgibacillus siamensis]|uniref:YkvA family protein n=1 Tax=Virgibacillus siamensis TaxID=480071 RepID=UPI0031E3C80A
MKRLQFLIKFHKSIPFIKDFFRSAEVKSSNKWLFAMLLIGYITFPFDIIPDFLIWFGIFDDITVAAILLQWMVKIAPDSLKAKHQLFDQEI